MSHINNICVFSGTSENTKREKLYQEKSREILSGLRKQKYSLILGGPFNQATEDMAHIAIEMKIDVTTVSPYSMQDKNAAQKAIKGATHIYGETSDEVRQKLQDTSDAYVFLPGDYKVLGHLYNLLTDEKNKAEKFPKYSYKPILVCNLDGFFDGQRQTLDVMVSNGFLSAESRKLVRFINTPQEVMDILEALNSMPPIQAGVFASN